MHPLSAMASGIEPEPAPLRFAVYGDCRDGHDMHRKICQLIVASDASLVFQTGDLVHNGSIESQWKTFEEITAEMRKKAAYYPARGNHDFGDSVYFKNMTAPHTSGTADYYSVTKGNCQFIVLDVDE